MRIFQVCRDDLIKPAVTVQVQVIRATQQVHGKNKSHQTQIVVTVKMRDKNVVDAVHVRLVAHELHLRPLAAVYKEISILYFNEL